MDTEQASRKRGVLLNYGKCIICQEDNRLHKLVKLTSDGLKTINNARQIRLKLRNDNLRSATDRLTDVLAASPPPSTVCHNGCRASYTSAQKLERLKAADAPSSSSTPSSLVQQEKLLLRSKAMQINWNMCIFCQKDTKEKAHLIQEEPVSKRILEAAKYDPIMRTRLACVNDLTAADGRHHSSCHRTFKRRTDNLSKSSQNSGDVVLHWLCHELEQTASNADILELTDVWERYCTLAKEADITIPLSFMSRKSTFKQKLAERVDGVYEIIVLRDQARTVPRTLLIPTKFRHIPLSAMVKNNDEQLTIPTFKHQTDDSFLSMVHVALRIRGDMLSHPIPDGFEISEDRAIDYVPDSLYMFLNLLLGGQQLLDDEVICDDDKHDSSRQTRILSIAQDLVYTASGDKLHTPKHVGMGSTLHQATRSKELVDMFHQAGHVMSYRDIIKLDTALAEKTLTTMDADGSVVPPNLVEGRFVHFSTDNVDINEATVDGKGTFHATQVAAWQRGPPKSNLLEDIKFSHTGTLHIPDAMNDIIPAPNQGITECPYNDEITADWFTQSMEECPSAKKAHATDMAFTLIRSSHDPMPSWTSFNQSASMVNPEQTSVGYMPIIQAPAHDIDTLNTVVRRVMHVAQSLEQEHVVLTVDEGLYPKLMELKWSVDQYKDILIPCLGGLHIGMNFLGIIGRHMEDSGLCDLWVECDVLGSNAAQNVMLGKGYGRAMRTHKLTLQALWQILLPQLNAHLDSVDVELRAELDSLGTSLDRDDIAQIVDTLTSERFRQPILDFISLLRVDDPNAEFWWDYMVMVSILLYFTRAQRDGSWELHLYAFRRMLPFFFRYDHVNYARWGTVYLAEMAKLPPDILREFQQGNFVVKHANRRFNQVSPDHSTEWLNATGKKSGGLVGITKVPSALSRWTLSYNLRTLISSQTKLMLHITTDDDEDDIYTHIECTKGRRTRDDRDEARLETSMQQHGVFHNKIETLQNMINKDLATVSIQESLLGAECLGIKQLNEFVEKRMCVAPDNDQHVVLKAPIRKNKALTFATLYVVVQDVKGKQSTIKIDRNILQRLITAYRAGREVNLGNILKHELMSVPLSLATTSGTLLSSSKSLLSDILTKDVLTPPTATLHGPSCLLIDGQALVMALGKPSNISTFGEYAKTYAEVVYKMGTTFQRIDVTFDRYKPESIKAGTRTKRKKGKRPVRRQIESATVPLPSDWSNFMALEENKADLALLLSNYLIEHSPGDKTMVVAGGFSEATVVKSSDPTLDLSMLESDHEEADTRLILHCIHAHMESMVVSVRDTDVLLLMLAHYDKMGCSTLLMKAGTSKHPKYIPVHDIRRQVPIEQVSSILAFHAITGCDSVSQFSGHSKKTAWRVFQQHHDNLSHLGKGYFTEDISKSAEKFICQLYGVPEADTCDEARVKLFCIGRPQEALPPTSDAARFHIMRSHYQASVWIQAHVPSPDLPTVTDMGWDRKDGQLVPQLLSLPPIPKACAEIMPCGCTKGCLSKLCSCRKMRLPCIEACKCHKHGDACRNILADDA